MSQLHRFTSAATQREQHDWYDALARQTAAVDTWTLMNYGYLWRAQDGPPPPLPPVDDVGERNAAAMYWRVAHLDGGIDGKRVLEVGSGRGGGAAYLCAHTRPARYTGLDLAPAAVELANRRYAQPGRLEYVVGDSEDLPFEAATFDAVINVESSHAYGKPARFFAAAAHVLKPGGALLWCDFRPQVMLPSMFEMIAAAELTIEVLEDIREIVVAAVASRPNEEIRKGLQQLATSPEHLQRLEHFAMLPGTVAYQRLESGEDAYLLARLRR